MNYNDYRIHLLTCEYLNREPTGQYKTVHDFLTDLWDGVVCVLNERNEMINIQKDGVWVFAQDYENDVMWCADQLRFFFMKDMGMELPETRDFICGMMKEHLCCKSGMVYWVQ